MFPFLPLFALSLLALSTIHAEISGIKIKGRGFFEYGRIESTSDTLEVNYNNNTIQNASAQFTAIADIGENWTGALGFGGVERHVMQGKPSQARFVGFTFANYLTEARMTYASELSDHSLKFTFGYFPYHYNKNIRNLGAYLIRGPVYPGCLISGFEHASIDSTRGNTLGLWLRHESGMFSHDLILSNEREFAPSFDWHLTYVAKLNFGNVLELGSGINFYRLIAETKEITDPSEEFYTQDITAINRNKASDSVKASTYAHPYEFKFVEADSFTMDGDDVQYHNKTEYTHRGIKLMGMMSLDFKPLLGLEDAMRPDDFKLYMETALVGVKNYGTIYNKRSERIPFVFGINLPTFGWLDVLNLEIEYYGARYKNDTRKIQSPDRVLGYDQAQPQVSPLAPSPIPVSYQDYAPLKNKVDESGRWANDTTLQIVGTKYDIQNMTEDNLKWSVYLSKTIQGQMKFSFQIACDHFRPGPVKTGPINERGGSSTILIDPNFNDFYYMTRISYFF